MLPTTPATTPATDTTPTDATLPEKECSAPKLAAAKAAAPRIQEMRRYPLRAPLALVVGNTLHTCGGSTTPADSTAERGAPE